MANRREHEDPDSALFEQSKQYESHVSWMYFQIANFEMIAVENPRAHKEKELEILTSIQETYLRNLRYFHQDDAVKIAEGIRMIRNYIPLRDEKYEIALKKIKEKRTSK